MTSWLQLETAYLCVWCHRQMHIKRSVFASLISSIKFCCYCGHSLACTDDDIDREGFEKYNDQAGTQ